MTILHFKALHIIFVVSWFAGLFYMVRLFIYQTEAGNKPEPDKRILQTEYKRIERLLWVVITTPAMILTIITGATMLVMAPGYLEADWMWLKLSLMLGLLAYHFVCGRMMSNLKKDIYKISSFQLRLWNEVATIFLVSIVFVVVLKNSVDWVWGTLGFLLFGVLIMMAVKTAKNIRNKGKKA